MTPKEKAKQLVNQFYVPIMKKNFPNVAQMDVAAECAIIAMDIIFNTYIEGLDSGDLTVKGYYLQVIREIEKLKPGNRGN